MLSELIASLLTPSIIASLLKFAILFVLRMWIASWIRKQWHRIRPYLAPMFYLTMFILAVWAFNKMSPSLWADTFFYLGFVITMAWIIWRHKRLLSFRKITKGFDLFLPPLLFVPVMMWPQWAQWSWHRDVEWGYVMGWMAGFFFTYFLAAQERPVKVAAKNCL